MKSNFLRLLFAVSIFASATISGNIVHASPEEDIAAIQTQIDTLKLELEKVNTILNEKESNLNNTQTEIDKRNKALENVSSNINKTTTEEDINILAEELSTKIIESKTNSLFSGTNELFDLDTHPVSYSLLNNKEKSAYSVQIVNAALQETKKELDSETSELEVTKSEQMVENSSYKDQKSNIENQISNLENQISSIKAEQERIRLQNERVERIKQRYGITLSGTNSDILETAFQYLGVPYVWGGSSPSGFDCSGFVQYVYAKHGINLSRTTYTQIYDGIQVSTSNLQPGDLIFPSKDHVQIYIGNGRVIHAPQTGDVIKISPLNKVWKAVRVR